MGKHHATRGSSIPRNMEKDDAERGDQSRDRRAGDVTDRKIKFDRTPPVDLLFEAVHRMRILEEAIRVSGHPVPENERGDWFKDNAGIDYSIAPGGAGMDAYPSMARQMLDNMIHWGA